MTFKDWLRAHEGNTMRLYLGESATPDGSPSVTGTLHCHEDFVTVDQMELSPTVAIPYGAITSALEMECSTDTRVKFTLASIAEAS